MYIILLILAIGVLFAFQVMDYIKWRKGQMSLASFYRLLWYSHSATCACIILTFKLDSEDTRGSGNHIWNR